MCTGAGREPKFQYGGRIFIEVSSCCNITPRYRLLIIDTCSPSLAIKLPLRTRLSLALAIDQSINRNQPALWSAPTRNILSKSTCCRHSHRSRRSTLESEPAPSLTTLSRLVVTASSDIAAFKSSALLTPDLRSSLVVCALCRTGHLSCKATALVTSHYIRPRSRTQDLKRKRKRSSPVTSTSEV